MLCYDTHAQVRLNSNVTGDARTVSEPFLPVTLKHMLLSSCKNEDCLVKQLFNDTLNYLLYLSPTLRVTLVVL